MQLQGDVSAGSNLSRSCASAISTTLWIGAPPSLSTKAAQALQFKLRYLHRNRSVHRIQAESILEAGGAAEDESNCRGISGGQASLLGIRFVEIFSAARKKEQLCLFVIFALDERLHLEQRAIVRDGWLATGE